MFRQVYSFHSGRALQEPLLTLIDFKFITGFLLITHIHFDPKLINDLSLKKVTWDLRDSFTGFRFYQ